MPKDERLNIAAMLVIIGAVFVLIALNPSTSADQAKTFSSYQQLSDFLKERSEPSYGGGMLAGGMRGMEELAVVPTAMPGAATTDTGTKSTDYSTTNIQVEGVDEPDMVKSDGKYIYTTSSDGVAIIDAYPAQNMKVTSNISIDGSVSNMFINGNKLVVFGNNYGYWGGPRGEAAEWRQRTWQ